MHTQVMSSSRIYCILQSTQIESDVVSACMCSFVDIAFSSRAKYVAPCTQNTSNKYYLYLLHNYFKSSKIDLASLTLMAVMNKVQYQEGSEGEGRGVRHKYSSFCTVERASSGASELGSNS